MTVTPLAEALYQAALTQVEPNRASEAKTLWQLANRHDAVPPLVWPEVIEPYAGVRIAAAGGNARRIVGYQYDMPILSPVLPPAGAR